MKKSKRSLFLTERRVFDTLKKNCSDESKIEYERAISVLVNRYNTTIRENRFTVGGAVEVFTFALLKSVGINCRFTGDEDVKGDISLPNGKLLSLKSSFVGGSQNIGLLNKQGRGQRTWDTATLFILADIGVVYGTPEMVSPDYIKDSGDQLTLKKSGLNLILEDESNVFRMQIQKKPPTAETGFSLKASTSIAKYILDRTNAKNLLRYISEDI